MTYASYLRWSNRFVGGHTLGEVLLMILECRYDMRLHRPCYIWKSTISKDGILCITLLKKLKNKRAVGDLLKESILYNLHIRMNFSRFS